MGVVGMSHRAEHGASPQPAPAQRAHRGCSPSGVCLVSSIPGIPQHLFMLGCSPVHRWDALLGVVHGKAR